MNWYLRALLLGFFVSVSCGNVAVFYYHSSPQGVFVSALVGFLLGAILCDPTTFWREMTKDPNGNGSIAKQSASILFSVIAIMVLFRASYAVFNITFNWFGSWSWQKIPVLALFLGGANATIIFYVIFLVLGIAVFAAGQCYQGPWAWRLSYDFLDDWLARSQPIAGLTIGLGVCSLLPFLGLYGVISAVLTLIVAAILFVLGGMLYIADTGKRLAIGWGCLIGTSSVIILHSSLYGGIIGVTVAVLGVFCCSNLAHDLIVDLRYGCFAIARISLRAD